MVAMNLLVLHSCMPHITRRSIDYIALYRAVDRKRMQHNLSWREATRQITGGQNPTLGPRLRQGLPVTADMLGNILLWLGVTDIRPFLLPFTERRYEV